MAEKKAQLSIVLRTVDKATAGVRALARRLDAITKPVRDFKKAIGELGEKSGFDDVVAGFKGVGGAVADLLGKLLMIGGIAGAAVAGLFSLVDGFDELGDKAEAMGVSVDFLAQMRYAAELSGAAVEDLDGGLQSFTKNLGLARAGTGKMTGFLKKVSPALLTQLKAAKSNEAALDLLAGAMAKLEDPAKRAALAQATLGDATLAPLFAKGPKGIKELRDRYAELAPGQAAAAAAAGEVDDAMKDLKASTDGVKAALVTGLAPALKVVVERLQQWFVAHRGDIAAWAADIGARLPGAIQAVVEWLGRAYDRVSSFVESIGGLKTVAIAVGAALVGPLLSALTTLGMALLTNPVGLIVTGIAAAALLIVKYWEPIKGFFAGLWDGITAVFQGAWDVISGIVDKIVGAVDAVVGAVTSVKDFVTNEGGMNRAARSALEGGQGGGEDWVQKAIAATARPGAVESRVTVDFANAPRGTRVRTDPRSTGDVDLSVGYQLGTP